MAVVTGNDYDHIDIVNGSTQTRHMIKDASARADIADLKSAIINTDIPTMPAIASFFTGAGNIDFSTSTQTWSANPSRVGNESIFTASSDITLNVKSGFRYIVFIFTSENAYSGNSGWQTGEYTIPAGTHYSLEVSKTATTSAISISEAFSAIYETTLRNDINELTAIADEVTEKIPGVNLFDGIFDESGYINASGNQPSTNFKRTSKYYPIVGSDSNIIYFYLSQTVDTFSVLFYDANRNYVPGIVSVNNVQTKLGLIPSGAKYFRAYTRTAYSGDVTIALSQVDHYIPYQPIPAIKSNSIGFLQLTEDVVDAIGKPVKYAYVNGIADGVITGLYMLDAMYSFNGIEASASRYRLRFKKDGTLFVIGEDVSEEYYSDKILKVVVGTDLIGYAIIHYPVGGYAITSDSLSYTSSATNLDDNPVIKSYLARSENLVLVGDSMFGNYGQNCLESLLSMISDKQVFNCGFGGCRMAWRNATGSNAYDVFSFVSVADAIASGNYSAQIAQRSLNNGYPPRISALKSIDWSRPTTLFVEYVNNDITGDVAIGDLWDNTQTEFDKQTVLGAFNYGIKTILTAYPHVRVVQFTSAWRKLGSDAVPPYEYKNALNLGPADYDAAIKINAERQGISVYDYFRYGGRSWHNRDYYQVDNSHYNDKGYYMFARKLNALDHSFMD